MRMFELLPRPLGTIFRKLTHPACNSSKTRKYRLHRAHRAIRVVLVQQKSSVAPSRQIT